MARASELANFDPTTRRWHDTRRAAARKTPHRGENNVAMHNDNVFAGVARRARAPRAIRRVNRRSDRGFVGYSIPATPNGGNPDHVARAFARVAMRTWTLDALRAATEPVKVEAMQAIVEVGFCVVS